MPLFFFEKSVFVKHTNDEGDGSIQRALGQTDHGESPDIKLSRTSPDEQKKRNGRDKN